MAKKKKKKKSYGGKKNRKRVAAGKRAYKKTGLYKYNLKRKSKGRKKKKKGYAKKKKSKKRSGGGRGFGRGILERKNKRALVRRFLAKGYEPKDARALAERVIRVGRIRAAGRAKDVAVAKAKQQALANLFANIGAAGHLHKAAGN